KHPFKVVFLIPKSDPPQLTGNYSLAFKDFVSCCLQMSPSNRKSAKELLNHRFIRSAKKTSYLTEVLQRRDRIALNKVNNVAAAAANKAGIARPGQPQQQQQQPPPALPPRGQEEAGMEWEFETMRLASDKVPSMQPQPQQSPQLPPRPSHTQLDQSPRKQSSQQQLPPKQPLPAVPSSPQLQQPSRIPQPPNVALPPPPSHPHPSSPAAAASRYSQQQQQQPSQPVLQYRQQQSSHPAAAPSSPSNNRTQPSSSSQQLPYMHPPPSNSAVAHNIPQPSNRLSQYGGGAPPSPSRQSQHITGSPQMGYHQPPQLVARTPSPVVLPTLAHAHAHAEPMAPSGLGNAGGFAGSGTPPQSYSPIRAISSAASGGGDDEFDTIRAPAAAANAPIISTRPSAQSLPPGSPSLQYQQQQQQQQQLQQTTFHSVVEPTLNDLMAAQRNVATKSVLRSLLDAFQNAERQIPGISDRILHDFITRLE
ncbi:hypothetical protein GQ42DRAFT_10593, partial [Ramicandelaber brevisporus]